MADAVSVLDSRDAMTGTMPDVDERTAHRLAAFEELVQRHRTQIYRVAYRLAGNPDDAEDLAQEAVVEAFRAFDRYRPGTYFDRWLYRIMSRTYIDTVRRAGGGPRSPLMRHRQQRATREFSRWGIPVRTRRS